MPPAPSVTTLPGAPFSAIVEKRTVSSPSASIPPKYPPTLFVIVEFSITASPPARTPPTLVSVLSWPETVLPRISSVPSAARPPPPLPAIVESVIESSPVERMVA